MIRKLRPTKSAYQIKEEQINFLLEDVERNLEEYKKAIKRRDRQLADAKKILKNAKISYDSIIKENKQLKEYIANIKRRFNQCQQEEEEQNLLWEKVYFQRSQKTSKKVVHEEELTVNLRFKKVSTHLKTNLFGKKKRKNKNNFHLKEKTKYLST